MLITQNKKARHNFTLYETFEAGLSLQGTEVKSLRQGKASIAEAHVSIKDGEAFLHNAYIPVFDHGNRFNHSERRTRKLLLHKHEINQLIKATSQKGMTIVPTKMYFAKNGKAKIMIAMAKGKNLYDKRQSLKEKDMKRKLREQFK